MTGLSARAELSLRPRYSTTSPEFEGTLSTGKRRRLFQDVATALTWARERADVVEVRVDDATWSAGTTPSDNPDARTLDAAAEARIAAAIDEEFERDRQERKRYPDPRSWYFAFWVDPSFPTDAATAALKDVERITDVTVRRSDRDRLVVIVHLQARSREEVWRRGESEITEALRQLRRRQSLPGFSGAGVGHHEIGLSAFEHRNHSVQER